MEDKLRKFVRENREAFDSKTPSPEIWSRVKSRVEPPKKVRKMSFSRKWSVAAAILVCLTLAWMWQMRDSTVDVPATNVVAHTDSLNDVRRPNLVEGAVHTPEETAYAPVEAISDRAASNQKQQERTVVAVPREEEDSLENETAMMLAMLNNPHSAISRMEAVLQAREFTVLPTEIMEQLDSMVNYDSNSNVRVMALELLMAHIPMNEWDDKVQEVFVQQDDPIVQMELMQVMAVVDSIGIHPATTNKLYEITEDPLAIDFVKEQAYAVLMKNW